MSEEGASVYNWQRHIVFVLKQMTKAIPRRVFKLYSRLLIVKGVMRFKQEAGDVTEVGASFPKWKRNVEASKKQ